MPSASKDNATKENSSEGGGMVRFVGNLTQSIDDAQNSIRKGMKMKF